MLGILECWVPDRTCGRDWKGQLQKIHSSRQQDTEEPSGMCGRSIRGLAGWRVFQEEEFLGKDDMEISDSGHKTVG